jgi:hypothetical protein
MNIFVLHEDAIEAADMYCDKHVPKMVLELAQMLTTAHHAHGVARDGMYKVAHLNHPCSKWVRETGGNYRWAYHHFVRLAFNYWWRFGKMHKSYADHSIRLMRPPEPIVSDTSMTDFAQAMPDEYKHEDAVTAYRTYYINDKQRFAKWEKGVPTPDWWPND